MIVMKIDYQYWFSMDYWSFEEAALLFIGIDPRNTTLVETLSSSFFGVQYASNSDYREILSNKYNKMHLRLSHFNFGAAAYRLGTIDNILVTALFDKVIEKDIVIHRPLLDYWGANSVTHQQATKTTKLDASFKQLESLMYDEITITLLASDAVELSARNITKTFTYEALGLRDMRKKDGPTMNKAGLFLAACVSTKKPKPDPKLSKHKDELKKLINSWFGLKLEPFNIVGEPPSTRYTTKFTIKYDLNRAAKRIEYRTTHVSIDDVIETANFDDENDPAGNFLKGKE